jgi:hypothetical protein
MKRFGQARVANLNSMSPYNRAIHTHGCHRHNRNELTKISRQEPSLLVQLASGASGAGAELGSIAGEQGAQARYDSGRIVTLGSGAGGF